MLKFKCQKAPTHKRIRPGITKYFILIAWFFLITACGGGTKLVKIEVDESRVGKPVSSLLVIGVTYNQDVRKTFEDKMAAALNAAGVKAVTSVDTIPISEKQQLEKEKVLEVVKKRGNDAAIVTYLVYTQDKEVITRDFSGTAGRYGFLWSYGNVHGPGYSSVNSTLQLITNLYDVKTEKLVWSGESETTKAESLDKAIDDVIKVVIADLKKNKLL